MLLSFFLFYKIFVGDVKVDYEKIGKFITKKRKEKNLTQKDLAESLKITDRAVSRWERGLGCPDISLLENLSKLLEITILELLHGEEIREKDSENQVVVTLLNKNSKKLKIWKTSTLCFLNLLLILSICSFYFLFLFPAKIEKDENRVLYPIVTQSMSPTLKLYDVAIAYKKDIKEIKEGDIILYVSNAKITNGMTLLHRVVDKVSDEKTGEISLKTKGDNNYTIDEGIVNRFNLIGVLEKRIPFLGHFLPIVVLPRFIAFFNILVIFSLFLLDIVQFKNRSKKF